MLVSIVVAVGLVLKHQAISIHNSDSPAIVQDRFDKKIYQCTWNIYQIHFEEDMTHLFED